LQHELLKRAFEGDELAISRVLTQIEHLTPLGTDFLKEIIPKAGNAHTVGITGSPGAGKSTLIGALIEEYVRRGHRVGVILVDPTSPVSKGSFMGNRIRMTGKELEGNVFIRSLATRGHLGGLSADALLLIEAMDALGFDRIIVETVGAGQTDTEVMDSVHTIAVVTVPGTGDEIQALKAGLMEIGDIYVVNKADKPEAEMLYEAVKFATEGIVSPRFDWEPRIVKTIATRGIGVKELVDLFEEHMKFLVSKGYFESVVKKRRRKLVELVVRKKVENVISSVVNRADNLFEKFERNDLTIDQLIDMIYREVKLSL
jgi:LAO/AO transport system kinase